MLAPLVGSGLRARTGSDAPRPQNDPEELAPMTSRRPASSPFPVRPATLAALAARVSGGTCSSRTRCCSAITSARSLSAKGARPSVLCLAKSPYSMR